jgi:hypothetical protein
MANCTTTINLCNDSFKVCGDFGVNINDLITSDIDITLSVNELKDIFKSELIDVKRWKSQSSYPTLKLLYSRYLNSTSYCANSSSQFNYNSMVNFSELVGNYWIDLIDQVIPSTTIWGSGYIYRNTMWEQEKFKYRTYSLFSCDEPTNTPVSSPVIGQEDNVEVELEILVNDSYYDGINGISSTVEVSGDNQSCNSVSVIQTNYGSEFIGNVVILNNVSGKNNGDIISIGEF